MFYKALTFALLAGASLALQVAPDSPCSTLCIDKSGEDASEASSSNTGPEDISCSDNDYTSTAIGTKFQGCMSCLQTSSYSSNGESDQAWFLYNLRYTVDYCMFGSANNANTSTAIGGPCLTSSSCQSLQNALDGSLDPNGATFGYCTADGGIFTGDTSTECTQCLHDETDVSYLSNFMVALSAGCQQRPGSGTVIGLNQTVFSRTLVAITSPVLSATSSAKSGLPMGAKIGIIVGAAVLLLAAIGILIVCFKKRRNRKAALKTGCDPRFGASNITAPHGNGYNSPFYYPGSDNKSSGQLPGDFAIQSNQSYDPEKTALTELKLSRPASNETQFSSVSSSSPLTSPNPPPSMGQRSPKAIIPISMGQRSPNPPPSLNQRSPKAIFPMSISQRSPNPPPSLGQRSPNPPPSLNQRSPKAVFPVSMDQRSPNPPPSLGQRSPPPVSILKRTMTPVPVHTAYIPVHSPAYTFNGTSPQNSPPIPPPRATSAMGSRRAPTPLASFTHASRDDSGPRTGGSTKSNATATTTGFGSPATSPRRIPKSGPNSPQHPQIMQISAPQPQTKARAVEGPGHIDAQLAATMDSADLQNQFHAQAQALDQQELSGPPRSESRLAGRLLTRFPSVLTKTSAGKEAKQMGKAWSPDSPSPVEQWPGTM